MGQVTEPPVKFQFMRLLEGYPESTPTLDFARLERLGEWTPTEAQPAVRVVTDHGSVLVAAKGANVSIRTKGPATVVVGQADEEVGNGAAGDIEAIGVEGPVSVRIETTTRMLEAVPRPHAVELGAPSIQITNHGVVRDFTGVARLDSLRGQLISLNRDRPGRLVGIGDTGGGKLVGVDVTGIVNGAQFKSLGGLSLFSPNVDSLYDLACRSDRLARWLRKRRRRGLFDPTKDPTVTPQERAHWFRDLYGVIETRAVSASTRAALRWCYMLLEHEAIKRPRSPQTTPRTRRVRHRLRRETIENLGRWLHRCVGYGQRPSRALVSWLATSAVVIAWSAQSRTVEDGVSGWAERVSEVVLSPLRVLRLGSNGETGLLGGSGFEPIAYLLVGLPFIFFVLSLREFFRSPLNSRTPTV